MSGMTVPVHRVAKLWWTGVSGPKIAAQVGCSPQRIYQLVREYELGPRVKLPKPVKPRPTIADRFWAKVNRGDDCWEWAGGRNQGTGYGFFSVRSRTIGAHRAAWEVANGPIPAGIDVLHRCDNPPCVRPDHLFLGTHRDNMRDMRAKGRWSNGDRPVRTTCKYGHQKVYRPSGWACPTCNAEVKRRRQAA